MTQRDIYCRIMKSLLSSSMFGLKKSSPSLLLCQIKKKKEEEKKKKYSTAQVKITPKNKKLFTPNLGVSWTSKNTKNNSE